MLKISSDCSCNFNRDNLHGSTVDCKQHNGELVYSTSLEYSNNEGSETASVIANRIVGQAPFSMTVQGVPVTVTTACNYCGAGYLSLAAGGGMFAGGVMIGTFVMGIIIFVIVM